MPIRVSYCPECGWEHDGEDTTGITVLTDSKGKQYYICQLTLKEVYMEDAETFDGGRQDLD